MALVSCPYNDESLKKAWWKGYQNPTEPADFETTMESKAYVQGQRAHAVDIKPIPSGPYCYKFKEDPSKVKGGSYPIISCPHLSYEDREIYGETHKIGICKFLERLYPLTEDETTAWIDDQVKNCGENNDY